MVNLYKKYLPSLAFKMTRFGMSKRLKGENYKTIKISNIFKSFEITEYKNMENGLYEKFNKQIATFTACDFPNNSPF